MRVVRSGFDRMMRAIERSSCHRVVFAREKHHNLGIELRRQRCSEERSHVEMGDRAATEFTFKLPAPLKRFCMRRLDAENGDANGGARERHGATIRGLLSHTNLLPPMRSASSIGPS